MDEDKNTESPCVEPVQYEHIDPKELKKRFKKEGRRIKTLSPMAGVSPFIMVERNDATNMIKDTLQIDRAEKYIKEKQKEGMTNFSIMHLFIAAYIRGVSQYPAVNRFIRGQRVHTRDHIEVNITIKKEMNLESPDTCVKGYFFPDATAKDVYREMSRVIDEYRNNPGGDFDDTAKLVNYIPRLLKKNFVWWLKTLDYFGRLPRFLTMLSPFHGSLYITSMGSLGVPAIFHHLYSFGNVPLFLAFGKKFRTNVLTDEGKVVRHSFVDFTFVMDERICDGYYYAAALKYMKSIFRNPWQLDTPPQKVEKDLD